MTASGRGRGRRLAIALTACLLASVAAIAVLAREHLRALAFLDLPRPVQTGAFPVGRSTVTVGDHRSVDLWYPAATDGIGLAARIKAVVLAQMTPTQAVAPWDVPPATGAPHPLVLLLPSWFSERHENTFLAADLASHGFVVAAVDDVIHGAPLAGEDRAAQVSALDFESEDRFTASRTLSRRRVLLAARTADATLDALIRDPAVAPMIDPARIGVLGFSFGGSVAAAMARDTARVRAAINLDGDVIATEIWPPAVPYLFLTSDLPYPSAADLASGDLPFRFESVTTRDTYDLHDRPDMPRDSVAFSVRDATHTDFSDRLSIPPFRALFDARPLDRRRLRSDLDTLIVAFLARHLQGGADIAESDAPPARFRPLPRPPPTGGLAARTLSGP
ncbi:alpha/beta hydrolase family protein [Methylobacterium sp. P5_C11]